MILVNNLEDAEKPAKEQQSIRQFATQARRTPWDTSPCSLAKATTQSPAGWAAHTTFVTLRAERPQSGQGRPLPGSQKAGLPRRLHTLIPLCPDLVSLHGQCVPDRGLAVNSHNLNHLCQDPLSKFSRSLTFWAQTANR